jgi:hypothetical protein
MPGLFPEKVNIREESDLQGPTVAERYDSSRQAVEFWVAVGSTRLRCAISREALDDHFGGDGKDKLVVFRTNRQAIEEFARRKFLDGRMESDGVVFIRSADFV